MTSDASGEGLLAMAFDDGPIEGHSPLMLLEEIMSRLNVAIENKNECAKWRQIHKRNVRPHDVFDIIGGSGSGGLIAGMLSSLQLDAKHALDEYLPVAKLLYPSASSSLFASSPTSMLEDALKQLVESHHPSRNKHAPLIGTLADSSNGFIVAHRSHDIRTSTALFRTYRSRNPWDTIDCELWQAFRVTTADLGAGKFEDVIIEDQKYFGTSIKNGNPTEHLTSELRQRFPTQEVDLVLSLGCSYPCPIPLSKCTSKGVEKTFKALNKDLEETHERMSRHWVQISGSTDSKGPYKRLSIAEEMEEMEEESHSGDIYETIITRSKQYIAQREVSRKIDCIVGILEKRMIRKELELHSDLPRLPRLRVSMPEANPIYSATGRKKLLALDSGGLLAISEADLLDRLLDGDDKKPCEYFDLIGGCGTGGILAILFVRFKMSIREATATLGRLIEPLLRFIKNDNTDDPIRLTTVFATEISMVLRDLSGEALPKMFLPSPQKCKGFVLAHALDNLDGNSLRFFGTYNGGRSKTNYLIQDAIRSTMADRNLFLDAIVGEGIRMERFGGTGYGTSNPTYHLVEESKCIWPESPPPFVVSLGTGQVNTIPHPKARGKRDLLEILNKVSSNCEDTHAEMCKVLSPGLYHRFNVQHGMSDKEWWSLKEAEDVLSYVKAYCESSVTASRLKNVGEALDESFGNTVAQGNEVSDWERRLAAIEIPA